MIVAFAACKTDDCDSPISIDQLSPDRNPPGYEIVIEGNGFSADAVVRFGQVTAQTRDGGELGLVAQVPNGLVGVVELTVEEGDCIARSDFEVWSNFLPGTPASPTLIIIPQPPNYPLPGSFQNAWQNLVDEEHFIQLNDNDNDGEGPLDEGSREFHSSNALLDDNPATGSFDPANNRIVITIDRTAKGGIKETYDGQYIPIPPGAPGGFNEAALLLTSREDGRQLVILKPS